MFRVSRVQYVENKSVATYALDSRNLSPRPTFDDNSRHAFEKLTITRPGNDARELKQISSIDF